MRNPTRMAGPIIALVAFTISGCFSLGRKTPTLEQYVLGGTPAPNGATASRDLNGLTIGLRRLDLATYLATPAIVVRRGDHQIVTSEFHRWGEDLAEGINRAVAMHLETDARVRAVDIAPWPVGSRYNYLVQLHVSQLEGDAPEQVSATEGGAHVVATWEIIRQEDGAVLARGATDHRERNWKIGDYAALVTLLNKGLNALADDVIGCMTSLAQNNGSCTSATPRSGSDDEK